MNARTQALVVGWTTRTRDEFRGMLRTMHAVNKSLRHVTPRPCRVSTMTICGKLARSVDTASVVAADPAAFAAHGLVVTTGPKKRNASGDVVHAFYNQITIAAGNSSAKIFKNGSIQFTGAKSPIHFVDVVDRLCAALGGCLDHQPTLETVSISMINVVFSAARTLPMAVLRQAFEAAGHATSYDPDAYPGVKAKIAVNDTVTVTVMLFTTGNVIISGAKSPVHIASVYATVCGVIDLVNPQTQETEPPTCTRAMLAFYSITDGYSSRIADLCL